MHIEAGVNAEKEIKAAKELLISNVVDHSPGLDSWNRMVHQEKVESGTSPTGDEEFDRVGYKIVRNMCPPELVCTDVPKERGQLNYFSTSVDDINYTENESQVPGSVARYTYPPHRKAFDVVKKNVEKAIGQPLYKTYYYDRFYFPGQDLKIHSDRPSCEISVTIHCSSNLKDKWPIYIKSVDGNVVGINLESGDGLIYKGCERPHWRLPMPGVKRNKIRKFFSKEELYYHQIFFHYVLSDGQRSHYAGDESKHSWL